jgi:regulator of sigma E protease
MILAIIIVIALFSLLIFVHEFGHFLAARRNGVEVEEFGFGFPPRAIGRKVGRTLYSINWLPLGGFVRLKGEDQDDTSPGSFGGARYRVKAKILLAGVGMNALTAYVIFLALCLTGLPPVIAGQFNFGHYTYAQPKQLLVVDASKGSPAAEAGLARGSFILAANGQKLVSEDDLFSFTKAHAGEQVTFTVVEKGTQKDVAVILRPPDSKDGFLGVTPLQTYKIRYTWTAPIVAAGLTVQIAWATLSAFGALLVGLFAHGQVSNSVAGPVGIVALLNALLQIGFSYVWLMVASISMSLAIVNVLPIPALDGGRLALITVQRVTGKALSPKREALVHTIGFVLLIGLMVIVTVVDIRRVL